MSNVRLQEIKAEIVKLKKSIGKGSASKQVAKAVKVQIQELEKEFEGLKLVGTQEDKEDEDKEYVESSLSTAGNVVLGTEKEPAGEQDGVVDDEQVSIQDQHHQQPKISKSKKKKNKKMAQLEQDRRLAAEEAKNMPNPKEIEDGEIDRLATGISRRVYQVAADGHCLYNSIARQLELVPSLVADQKRDDHTLLPFPTSYKELRSLAASWIRDHQDEFLPFLVNKSGDMMNQDEFDAYCHECEYGAVWGGHFEIQALSQALKRPIHILQASAPLLTIGQEEFGESESAAEPLVLSYHKHAYVLGEHYNSLERI